MLALLHHQSILVLGQLTVERISAYIYREDNLRYFTTHRMMHIITLVRCNFPHDYNRVQDLHEKKSTSPSMWSVRTEISPNQKSVNSSSLIQFAAPRLLNRVRGLPKLL